MGAVRRRATGEDAVGEDAGPAAPSVLGGVSPPPPPRPNREEFLAAARLTVRPDGTQDLRALADATGLGLRSVQNRAAGLREIGLWPWPNRRRSPVIDRFRDEAAKMLAEGDYPTAGKLGRRLGIPEPYARSLRVKLVHRGQWPVPSPGAPQPFTDIEKSIILRLGVGGAKAREIAAAIRSRTGRRVTPAVIRHFLRRRGFVVPGQRPADAVVEARRLRVLEAARRLRPENRGAAPRLQDVAEMTGSTYDVVRNDVVRLRAVGRWPFDRPRQTRKEVKERLCRGLAPVTPDPERGLPKVDRVHIEAMKRLIRAERGLAPVGTATEARP